ncbi:MAG: hypothetical protein NZM28_03345, partial [Fimbriimonadales bacterium]|nr:hypothetical protein [Fimbriimonadales bacterium]
MATTAAPSQSKRARRAPKRKTNLPSADSIRATLDQLEQLLLPTGDGDRMESDWHVMSIPLLDELVR